MLRAWFILFSPSLEKRNSWLRCNNCAILESAAAVCCVASGYSAEFLHMIRAQQIDGKVVVCPCRRGRGILGVKSWSTQDELAYLKEGGY